jgi:hypothetical protein
MTISPAAAAGKDAAATMASAAALDSSVFFMAVPLSFRD